MSTTWWNCDRSSPLELKPLGQWATIRCACRRSARPPVWSTDRECRWHGPNPPHSGCWLAGPPSRPCDSKNSGVSRSMLWSKTSSSLNVPLGVPSRSPRCRRPGRAPACRRGFLELLEGVDETADLVVSRARGSRRTPQSHGRAPASSGRYVGPRRIRVRAIGQLGVLGDHA